MKMSKIIVVMLGAALLAACGNETDANHKNFSTALNHYFDKKGEICIDMPKWPVDITAADVNSKKLFPDANADRMHALDATGLAKGTPTDLPHLDIFGKPTGRTYKVIRYTLTAAAKPYERDAGRSPLSAGFLGNSTLCWGQMALDKVVKWEGPVKFGEYQAANVTYTYKVENIAEWAKKPEIQAAFPSVKSTLDGMGTKELQHGVKLTSVGWEA